MSSERNRPVEQTTKYSIRPLLGLPPFTALPLLFVYRDDLLGNLQIDDRKEQLTPRNQALRTLLICAEVNHNTSLVRLQNKMQHRRDFLRCARGRLQHLRGDADKDREDLGDDLRQNIALLAESTPHVHPSTPDF